MRRGFLHKALSVLVSVVLVVGLCPSMALAVQPAKSSGSAAAIEGTDGLRGAEGDSFEALGEEELQSIEIADFFIDRQVLLPAEGEEPEFAVIGWDYISSEEGIPLVEGEDYTVSPTLQVLDETTGEWAETASYAANKRYRVEVNGINTWSGTIYLEFQFVDQYDLASATIESLYKTALPVTDELGSIDLASYLGNISIYTVTTEYMPLEYGTDYDVTGIARYDAYYDEENDIWVESYNPVDCLTLDESYFFVIEGLYPYHGVKYIEAEVNQATPLLDIGECIESGGYTIAGIEDKPFYYSDSDGYWMRVTIWLPDYGYIWEGEHYTTKLYEGAEVNEETYLGSSWLYECPCSSDEAKTYTVVIEGLEGGGYTGQYVTSFQVIDKKRLSVYVESGFLNLDGSYDPHLNVYDPSDDEKELVEGEDYAVEYRSGNTYKPVSLESPGFYYAVVTGMGDYAGTYPVAFRVYDSYDLSSGGVEVRPSTLCFEWTGDPIYPVQTVTINGVQLEEDVDYTIEYRYYDEDRDEWISTTDAPSAEGNYEAYVRGTGTEGNGYYGEFGKGYEIAKDFIYRLYNASPQYRNGEPISLADLDNLEFTFYFWQLETYQNLVEDRDYTLSIYDYDENLVDRESLTEGYYHFVFDGIPPYEGQTENWFTVNDSSSISHLNCSVGTPRIPAQGQTPVVPVTLSYWDESLGEDVYLVEGDDYTVDSELWVCDDELGEFVPATTYDTNRLFRVKISGIGSWTGERYETFYFDEPMRDIGECIENGGYTITGVEDKPFYYSDPDGYWAHIRVWRPDGGYLFNCDEFFMSLYEGTEIGPETYLGSVSDSGAEGFDSCPCASDEAKTYTVVITGVESGGYTGEYIASFQVIDKKRLDVDVESGFMDLDGSYDPHLRVYDPSDDEKELVEGEDYAVEYRSWYGYVPVDPQGPGIYYAVVTGLGDYAGTYPASYRVFDSFDLSSNAVEVLPSVGAFEWTGEPVYPIQTVIINGVQLEEDVDYTIEYRYYDEDRDEWIFTTDAPSAEGNYEVYVRGTGTEGNGYYGEYCKGYEIAKDLNYRLYNASPQYRNGEPISLADLDNLEFTFSFWQLGTYQNLAEGRDYTLSIYDYDENLVDKENIIEGDYRFVFEGIPPYEGQTEGWFTVYDPNSIDRLSHRVSGLVLLPEQGELPDVRVEVYYYDESMEDYVYLTQGEDYTVGPEIQVWDDDAEDYVDATSYEIEKEYRVAVHGSYPRTGMFYEYFSFVDTNDLNSIFSYFDNYEAWISELTSPIDFKELVGDMWVNDLETGEQSILSPEYYKFVALQKWDSETASYVDYEGDLAQDSYSLVFEGDNGYHGFIRASFRFRDPDSLQNAWLRFSGYPVPSDATSLISAMEVHLDQPRNGGIELTAGVDFTFGPVMVWDNSAGENGAYVEMTGAFDPVERYAIEITAKEGSGRTDGNLFEFSVYDPHDFSQNSTSRDYSNALPPTDDVSSLDLASYFGTLFVRQWVNGSLDWVELTPETDYQILGIAQGEEVYNEETGNWEYRYTPVDSLRVGPREYYYIVEGRNLYYDTTYLWTRVSDPNDLSSLNLVRENDTRITEAGDIADINLSAYFGDLSIWHEDDTYTPLTFGEDYQIVDIALRDQETHRLTQVDSLEYWQQYAYIVKGLPPYKGTVYFDTYTVDPRDIGCYELNEYTKLGFTFRASDTMETGSPITPNVYVSSSSVDYENFPVFGTDYFITSIEIYREADGTWETVDEVVAAGTYRANLEANPETGWHGTNTAEFKVLDRYDLSAYYSYGTFVYGYTGQPIVPDGMKVATRGYFAYQGQDFEIVGYEQLDNHSYVPVASAVEVGQYHAIVRGKNPYHGETSVWFKIVEPNNMLLATIDMPAVYYWDKDQQVATATDLGIVVYDYEGNKLVEGTDYTAEFVIDHHTGETSGTVTSPGYYSVTIKGKGNYVGEQDSESQINVINLYDFSTLSIHLANGRAFASATGGECLPNFMYDYKSENGYKSVILKYGEQYTVKKLMYSETSNGELTEVDVSASGIVGFYRMTIEGIDPYYGEKTIGYQLFDPMDIRYYNPDSVTNSFWYDDGQPIEVTGLTLVRPDANSGSVTIAQGTEFTIGTEFSFTGLNGLDNAVIVSQPTELGWYSVEAQAIPPYEGTTQVWFEVLDPADFANYKVRNYGNPDAYGSCLPWFYGQQVTAGVVPLNATIDDFDIIVRDGRGNVLRQDVDYDVVLEFVVNDHSGERIEVDSTSVAGSYYLSFTGKNGYKGMAKAYFTASDIKYPLAQTTISGIEETYEATGEAIALEPVVEFGSVELTEGKDYVVSYADANGVSIAAPSTAGTYRVVVTAAEGSFFVGSTFAEFEIVENAAIDITNATVTLKYTSMGYTGGKRNNAVTSVVLNGVTLDSDNDFTVTYANNINVGTATAIVTGTGKYTGTVTKTFKITAKSIADADVTLRYTSMGYTGGERNNAVTSVMLGDLELNPETDYEVSYENNVNVGTATVTVTGTGNYKGTATKTFKITAKSLAAAEIALKYTSMGYTGAARKDAVTSVILGDEELVEGDDFTVSYSNNVNVGTATATITGTGNYKGTASKTFKITAKSLAAAEITLKYTSMGYTGAARNDPVTSVMLGDVELVKDTDFTVSYTNNVEVGTATTTITGTGNYKGTATKTFKITAKSLAAAEITLKYTSMGYTGGERKDAVTSVVLGDAELVEGDDFTVSYSNNVNVGTATVTITGTGNYKGTATATFKITAKSLAAAEVTLAYKSMTYTGAERKPSVKSAVLGDVTLVKGTDFTVSYTNNVNVGTATVTITGTGNYKGTATATFKITAKSLAAAEITLAYKSMKYTGTARKPAVKSVVLGDVTLVSGTDFTVSYKDNVNIGTATVTITGKGNYKGTATKTFKIVTADSSTASTYVANTSTLKFHKETCRDISQMNDENRATYVATHDEMVSMGYSPCGHCKP